MKQSLSIPALLWLASCASMSAAAPNISNLTNTALPSLNAIPDSITLARRSMATIWGTNLASTTASISGPWMNALGGLEVHLAGDECFDSSCELIAPLIYVSPTQVNFMTPDDGLIYSESYRVVLIRDGERFDNRSYIIGGPGRITLDDYPGENYDVVFQIGYDCLYSYSLSDPPSCGISWAAGTHRAPLGAFTDALSGEVISSQNPVHQGQIISVWITNILGGVSLGSDGLMEAYRSPVNFGIAQLGKDLTNYIIDFGATGPYKQLGVFQTLTPLWEGETPQWPGLDLINVAFPMCNNPKATSEKRYDAFVMYNLGTTRLYLPFIVRPGDPDCNFN